MKTRHHIQIALLAAFTSSGLHATAVENQLPVPQPDFMTSAQLTKWRAETTAKTVAAEQAQAASSPKTYATTGFYTGKPYMAESGSYAFKYREYNPEMSRWTTVDPSGFPDGANNRVYVENTVTRLVDPLGLFNSHKFIDGSSEFFAGSVAMVGGALLILNSGETFGISGAFGVLGVLSGGLGVTSGLADMGQGFANTDSWVPSSMGSFVGYTTARLSGYSDEASQEFAHAGSLVEDFLPESGIKGSLVKQLFDWSQRYSDASATITGYRPLTPATNSKGEQGYE